MALVTKTANLIEKNKDKDEVSHYLAGIPNPEEWT